MLRPWRVVALALMTACTVTPSEVAADAEIRISGTVEQQDGAALSGVPVELVRHEGAMEAFVGVVSLGTSCLTEQKKLSLCRSAQRTETEGPGRFSFTLKGGDTQGTLGDASTLEATAHLPRDDDEAAGPTVTMRFLVQTEQIRLPMRAWQPDIEAVAGPRSGTVTWSEIPPAILPPGVTVTDASTTVIFERGGGEIVWAAPGRNELATFDPRVLEDSKGSVSVLATWTDQSVSDELGRTVDVLLRSGRPGYRGRAGAPPSRGAVCAVRAADGSLTTRSPCPLSDGDFATPMGPAPCPDGGPCSHIGEAVLDWGGVRPVGLIVLRGCRDACTVETSPDGRTWTLAATTAAGDAAITALEGTHARFVRVLNGDVEALRELSVWEPGGPAGSPVSILADIAGGLIPPIDPTIGEGGRTAPIAAAALLLALIGGALGATALQRARPQPPSRP